MGSSRRRAANSNDNPQKHELDLAGPTNPVTSLERFGKEKLRRHSGAENIARSLFVFVHLFDKSVERRKVLLRADKLNDRNF